MKRRGVSMIFALTVVTLVGATISLLALYAGQMLQQRRDERARTLAQVVLDSGIAYANTHRAELRAAPPAGELALPTEGLLDPSSHARLTLHFQNGSTIRVRAVVEQGSFRASEEATLPIGG